MMQVRPYQRDTIDAIRRGWAEFKRQLVVLPTGAGKTIIAAHVSAEHVHAGQRVLFLAHREELLLQTIDKFSRAAGLRCELEKAEHHASRTCQVVVGSVQTFMARGYNWDADHFDLVIVDECFPAGTLIDSKPIEKIQVGDTVRTFNEESGMVEESVVTRTFAKAPASMVRIRFSNGTELTCTGNHPIATTRGWVPAQVLTKHDVALTVTRYETKNLQRVREGIHSAELEHSHGSVLLRGVQSCGEVEKAKARRGSMREMRQAGHGGRQEALPDSIREGLLQSGVLGSAQERSQLRHHGRDKQEARQRQNADQQPNEGSRHSGEGENEIAGNGLEAASSLRERHPYHSPKDAGVCVGLGDGGSDFYASVSRGGHSELLQGGHRQHGVEGGYRGGWQFTQRTCSQRGGQKEGRTIALVGVESVEVLQPTSDGTFGGVCPGGLVYNLEVARTHTYIANGVVVHNCHHVAADSYRRVLDMFPDARVLGITATPDRADSKSLGGVFQNIAAEVKLFDLIADGYLAPITLKAIPLQIDLNGVKSIAGDFAADDLGNRLEPLLGNIARGIAEHASFRRVLAFLPLIATSQKFVAACRAEGLHAEHIDGESPDRREKLERFARGEFDLLSNAMLLTEGFDDPGIDCVCVLRPTRSRPLYSQMVGRGTRIHPAKENLLLLDFLWMHQRHALVRPASLIAHTDEEAEAITELAEEKSKAGGSVEELELEGLASEATAQREAALLKKLAENKGKRATVMTAEEFALQHHSMETAEFEPVMEWEKAALTEKQAWCLKRAKIDLSTVRGKGHASKLISLIKGTETLTLATPGQRYAMRKAGHPNWSNATQHEARQFFAGLRRK